MRASAQSPDHPFKKWRLKKGLSQLEMAERIGTTQSRVSKFESGVIERLEPDQADAAWRLSRGKIKREHCLYDTPHQRLQTRVPTTS